MKNIKYFFSHICSKKQVIKCEDRYVEGNRAVWKALEDAYMAGKLKAIGVSN